MSKRALLVGCNYPGTKCELHGCANDVTRMKKCLIEQFGFDEADILVLLDTDKSLPQPTGANIRSSLAKLIKGVGPGDSLVFHYSGHGTQVPGESGEADDTGKEEAIVPTDMNFLTDDDFREVVDKIPAGVRFTFISDSCHSGGLIDSEKEQIGGGLMTYASIPPTGHATSGQGGGQIGHQGGSGGLMGLVSQGLQKGLESYVKKGHGGEEQNTGLMGMFSQGLSALSKQGRHEESGYDQNKTRDFIFPSDDDRRHEGEGHHDAHDRHRGERRHGEQGYGWEGSRHPGGEYRHDGGEYVGGYEYQGERREEGSYGWPERREEEGYGRHERREDDGYGRHGRREDEGYGQHRRREDEGYGRHERREGEGYGHYDRREPVYGGNAYTEGGYCEPLPHFQNKSLSIETLTEILSERTGQNVKVGNIRTTIFDMFGDDASPAVKTFVNVILNQLKSGGGNSGGWMGMVESVAGQFLKTKLGDQSYNQAANYVAPAVQGGAPPPPEAAYSGMRPSKSERLPSDAGILLSGCQHDETSADANPSKNKVDSYGAFSNAIQIVLAKTRGPISNRSLVTQVRSVLAQQGFKQHPCLYSSDQNAEASFICD